MARRAFRVEWSDARLERREMLSGAAQSQGPAAVSHATPPGRDPFHQNGIDGSVLHKSFVNRLNDRLAISQGQATRVVQAFQVFVTDYASLPVGSPPSGSTSPTLADLIAALKSEVTYALATNIVISSRPSPSASRAPTISPLAPRALIPFAGAQIDALGSALAAAPPAIGPDGVPRRPDPTPAADAAINAILNAEAETSVHPNLFQDPGDFYLSPDVTFDIHFGGDAPARSGPGYFVHGPHGVLLPGANGRPHRAT